LKLQYDETLSLCFQFQLAALQQGAHLLAVQLHPQVAAEAAARGGRALHIDSIMTRVESAYAFSA
jgi:hypothetical protein